MKFSTLKHSKKEVWDIKKHLNKRINRLINSLI